MLVQPVLLASDPAGSASTVNASMPPGLSARMRRGKCLLEHAEIHQRVGRDHHVVTGGMRAHERHQLAFVQLIVDIAFARFREHAGGKIHAHQLARAGAQQRAAQARAGARIQHDQPLFTEWQ